MSNSISPVGGSTSQLAAFQKKNFSKIDINGDGKVSKDEFVSGGPKEISVDKKKAFFDKLDNQGKGELSESDFVKNFPGGSNSSNPLRSLTNNSFSTIINLTKDTQTSSSSNKSSNNIESDFISKIKDSIGENIYSNLDSDKNGTVSKNEFISNRPKGISDSQATSLYDSIDTEKNGSITKEQFKSSLKNGPSGKSTPESASSTEIDDFLKSILSELDKSSTSKKTNETDQSIDEFFVKVDTDKSGTITESEFLASRPKGISENQASEQYKSIDVSNTGEITKDQFKDNIKKRPLGPPSSSHKPTNATNNRSESLALDLLVAPKANKAYGTTNKNNTDNTKAEKFLSIA
jgi:Ca2+-binding EF-hand superfamily protein